MYDREVRKMEEWRSVYDVETGTTEIELEWQAWRKTEVNGRTCPCPVGSAGAVQQPGAYKDVNSTLKHTAWLQDHPGSMQWYRPKMRNGLLSGLGPPLMYNHDLCCLWVPYVGQWSWCCHKQGWWMRPVLLPQNSRMVYTPTWSHVDVHGLCCL